MLQASKQIPRSSQPTPSSQTLQGKCKELLVESGPEFDSMSYELPHRITKYINRCERYEQRLRWFAIIKFGEEYTGKKSTGISAKSVSFF